MSMWEEQVLILQSPNKPGRQSLQAQCEQTQQQARRGDKALGGCCGHDGS